MTFAAFFHDYWWLIFPIFGMIMAFQSVNQSENRARALVDLVRSYTAQGKDPPPELLRMAAQSLEEGTSTTATSQNGPQYRVRSFFFLIGVAGGCATAYAFTSGTEDWAWVFLPFAVATVIMAIGQIAALFVGRKP